MMLDSVTDIESLYAAREFLSSTVDETDSYVLLSVGQTCDPEPTECMFYAARLVKDAMQMRQIDFKRSMKILR